MSSHLDEDDDEPTMVLPAPPVVVNGVSEHTFSFASDPEGPEGAVSRSAASSAAASGGSTLSAVGATTASASSVVGAVPVAAPSFEYAHSDLLPASFAALLVHPPPAETPRRREPPPLGVGMEADAILDAVPAVAVGNVNSLPVALPLFDAAAATPSPPPLSASPSAIPTALLPTAPDEHDSFMAAALTRGLQFIPHSALTFEYEPNGAPRTLGNGGSSTVRAAVWCGSPVAVKICTLPPNGDTTAFFEEAQCAQHLASPSLLKVLGVSRAAHSSPLALPTAEMVRQWECNAMGCCDGLHEVAVGIFSPTHPPVPRSYRLPRRVPLPATCTAPPRENRFPSLPASPCWNKSPTRWWCAATAA